MHRAQSLLNFTHAARADTLRTGRVVAFVVEAAPAFLAATHPAFELLKVDVVNEYTIKRATYRHKQYGAEVVSAQANNDNIGIVFRTLPSDSTELPHILEHSVLCG